MRRTINISRPDPSIPWGFRIQGGRDFEQQLRIASVTPGGLAEKNGIRAGDLVISIGGDVTNAMTHQQAQQAVIRCCNQLEMEIVESASDYGGMSEAPRPYTGLGTNRFEAPIAQSTVNINLHKPSPASHSPRGLDSHQTDNKGFNDLENYAPKPFSSRLTEQDSATQPYTQPLHQFVSYNKPTPPTASGVANTRLSFAPTARPSSATPIANQSAVNGSRDGKSTLPVGVREAKLQPEGFRRHPICHHCKSPIQGPFVDTVDYCFCPNHFFCFTCRVPLNNRYFAEEDGKFYCQEDFIQRIASRCTKCGNPIIGMITKALGKSWHPNCFVCCLCKRPLRDKFHVEDSDRVLCEEHWEQLHLTECAKCKQPVSEIDRFIEAFGKQFHAKCFSCAACQCPLEGKPFHSRDNRPFCLAHANAGAIFG